MFDNLSDKLSSALQAVRGQSRITEDNIKEALRAVRIALLEADVALPVIQDFIATVRSKALGQSVSTGLTGGQAFIRTVHEELKKVLGDQTEGLREKSSGPLIILMAGLQGAGKTTTVAKLGNLLRERQKKKVLVVSADVYRPAAIEQLETMAGQAGVEFLSSTVDEKPEAIARRAVEAAKASLMDVVLIDTAGRLAIDDAMMDEMRQIHAAVSPDETLFVVDSMTGQDAANTAKAFGEALPLTGVVLTKADGDARGGAALSVKQITGKPIKFIGVSEKIDGIEPFHPDRMAQRILGMGDVLSLVEEVERKVDKKQAEKLARKMARGTKFNFNDFKEQLVQMQNMGGLMAMAEKLPGMNQLPAAAKDKMNDKEVGKMIAIVNSMTPQERSFPDLMGKGSRKRRVANGSGTTIQDISRLLKQFNQMQKMMKKVSKGGMAKMMKKMKGRMPPGFPPIG